MAKFTMELREVCNIYSKEEVEKWFSSYNLSDFLTEDQIEVISRENIWTKEKLASKIVNHYFMREIGFETPYLFRHYALNTMNEIMEEYLLKIYTKFLEYDPLGTVDYVEDFTRNIENEAQNAGSSESSSNNTVNSFNINNDTPQTNVTRQNINNGLYASSTAQNESNSEISDETSTLNNGSSSTEEVYKRKVKGNNAAIITNEDLVQKFRNIAKSFDLEIIEKLNTLFMGIY